MCIRDRAEIDRQLAGLGAQKLDIGPQGSRGMGGVRMSASSFFTLNEGDAEAIRREVDGVQYVSGVLRGNTQAVYADNNVPTSWYGVEPDWFGVNGWEMAAGDFTGADKTVILGETVRREPVSYTHLDVYKRQRSAAATTC